MIDDNEGLPPQTFCLCRNNVVLKQRGLTFSNQRSLYACAACGLHQLAPYPVSSNDDDAIYKGESHLDEIGEREYYGYFRALFDNALAPLATAKSRILDFGAGSCHYQHFLEEMGYEQVWSLEINRHLTDAARSRWGISRVINSFDELPLEPFDLIYANQVFEHVHDPLSLLEGPFAKHSAPGSHIVITVPNFASLNRVLLGSKWIGYSPAEHIWFFKAENWKRLITNSSKFELVGTKIRSAVNSKYDAFRPRSFLKRAYYCSAMRLFEAIGRGDQLIVTLRRKHT